MLYRWFGVGKMPPSVRDALAGERELFFAEGIRVTLRRRGRVPGSVVAGGAVRAGWGAFAITDNRVVGTRGPNRWVDVPIGSAAAGADGPGVLTIDATGLHVDFDLDKVHPSCHGEMRIHYQQAIPPEVLARLPVLEQRFDVDPQRVVRMWGSRKKLPD